ncbi:hypothetical protein CF319_g9640 [Tilletia indica]|nr:hypothetical protein CF319_g9640 [Tilletia indica]
MGLELIERQRNLRDILTAAITHHDTSDLANVRELVSKVVTLRHKFDEVFVEPTIITVAVNRVFHAQNYDALLELVHRPLSFRPSAWPKAFFQNGKGFLYLREDQKPIITTLSTFGADAPAQT